MNFLLNPIKSNFRIFFAKDFLYEEINEEFGDYFFDENFSFLSLIDYINLTAIDMVIPGVVDTTSPEQTRYKGLKQTFASATRIEEMVESKKLSISFQHKSIYFNWLILRRMFELHVGKTAKNADTFLPQIYLHILDNYGNIILELIFKEIRIESVPQIQLLKNDIGIKTENFICGFTFNKYEFKNNIGKLVNYTAKEYKY
jgi:hypothetical protein